MSGMTGGTASNGIRIAAPASHRSASTRNSGGVAGASPGDGEACIVQDASDPARALLAKAYAKSVRERAAKLHGASAYAASACWPTRAAVPASTFAGQQGIRRHEVAMSTSTSGSRMLPTDRIDY